MDYPRVTEVLRVYTNYDKVPKQILDRAAARGTSVHALCAAIAKGDWIPEGMIDEELRGYVKSFRKWADQEVEKFVIIEQRYSCDVLEYSGQLDYVVLNKNDELWLVDLKTSATHQKTHIIQMAAYKHLLTKQDIKIKGAILVYLDKSGGEPSIERYEHLGKEMVVFVSALTCHEYFNKKGKKHATTDS